MSSYRLRHWSEYERALEARGSLCLWLSRETLARWRAEPPPRRRRGHPRLYSEEAITALLTLSALYHLGLRETAGFVRSVVAALGLALPVPDHTTLSRRRARLAVSLPVTPPRAPLHLVVDSTGLAVRGEGSWQQHRWRRGVRLDVPGAMRRGVPPGRVAQRLPVARPTELVPGWLTRAIVRNLPVPTIYAPKPPTATSLQPPVASRQPPVASRQLAAASRQPPAAGRP